MTQGHALLLQVLTDDYGLLKGRLTRRLGSPDIADEVLQEAYLRVERMPAIGAVLRVHRKIKCGTNVCNFG